MRGGRVFKYAIKGIIMKPVVQLMKILGSGLRLLGSGNDKYRALVDETVKKLDEISKSVENSESKGVMDSKIPKLTFEEGRIYTKKQTIKHIIATEEHFRSGLCSACLLEKHLPALEMYAEEGMSYCIGDECEAYEKLHELVKEVESELMKGIPPKERQLEIAEKFREVRKRLSGYEGYAKALEKELGKGD